MKLKSLNIALTAILCMMLLPSCNSWLDDVKQTGTVSDEIVWQNEDYVDLNLNSFYTFLAKYGQFGSYQFGGSLTESLTDAFKYGSVALGHKAGHPNNYVTNPDVITPDGCLYGVWDLAYGNIRQVNQFLELQKKYSKFSDEKNLVWEAQARFFRAFIYFQLAKRHGAAILYDALPTSTDKALATSGETWDFIEQDLEFAAKNLPEVWDASDKGRLTKGAAYAMLSRAMLYAERWQKAYDAACEVEKSSAAYDLVPEYSQSWKGGNVESILEFRYDRNAGLGHSFDKDYVPMCDGWDYGALGTPTQEMVECYENADGTAPDWSAWHSGKSGRPAYESLEPRFQATVIYNGCKWKGKTMDCSVGGTNGEFMPYREQAYSYGKTTTGYFLRKLLNESIADINNQSDQTWVEIRFAEVLLNKAEAAYRLGKMDEARTAMDRVRSRVGLPGKESTGDGWFKDYRNERKVELAYEGHLFWDMRRWKLAHVEYNGYRCHGLKISGSEFEYIDCDGADRKFPQKLYVLPIPSSELKNNGLVNQFDVWK